MQHETEKKRTRKGRLTIADEEDAHISAHGERHGR